MEQMIGQRLGNAENSSTGNVQSQRYQIKALLGKQVGRRTFLAEDRLTNTLVVIKLVLFGPDFAWDDLKLFQREAQTLQSLAHPAIPKYLDSFDVDTPLGRGFALVQTYIEAKSLREWVGSGHTFNESDLRAIATHLLNILKYLHQRQPPVIHRDIKPSNILLPSQGSSTQGGIYLVDFGSVQTAPSSGTMTVVGTYGYMPPEQFGGRAQPASDLYSLGATLIYLITGQHPAELTQDNLQIAFTPPDHLTPSFTQWIQQLTNTDLSKRTASAQQALQQLTAPPKPAVSTSSVLFHNETDLPFQSAHKEIKIFSAHSELEIQFSAMRLKDTSLLTGLGSTFLGLFKIVGFLIGLSIGGWLFLFIALIVWPMMTSQKNDRRSLTRSETAHLRIWELAEGSFQLSLSTTSYQDGSIKRLEHYPAPLSIRTIDHSAFSNAVLFNCGYQSGFGHQTISVSGDYQDIRWMSKCLERWTDGLIDEERGLVLWNR